MHCHSHWMSPKYRSVATQGAVQYIGPATFRRGEFGHAETSKRPVSKWTI